MVHDIGSSLVITILTAAFSPSFIDFGVSFSQKIVFRCLDKGFKIKTENTKTKTIQYYVNLYSGPDYSTLIIY
jgi:hypothetical protein